jgi:hypothetical protein
MQPDLATLLISEAELERLTGVDVGDVFVGGIFGGVYRPVVFRSPTRFAWFCLIEILMALLLSVVAIPVALLLTRNAAKTVQDAAAIAQFIGIWLGCTGLGMLAWNLYMRWIAPRFRRLMALLDAVDQHHAIVQAVHLLDQLVASRVVESAAFPQHDAARRDRHLALDSLHLTRASLVSGLQTERILREHRGFLARQSEVMELIETNLATLRTLEVNHQATEYGQMLHDALQVGLLVHREMHQP